jgi:kumamolisin
MLLDPRRDFYILGSFAQLLICLERNLPMSKIHPYFKFPRIRAHNAGTSYTAKQLAAFYGLPLVSTVGAGKKVAVIELGGGFNQALLTTYFTSLGYPNVPSVVFHSISGATNAYGDSAGDYVEVMLDLAVIGGMAPGCQMHCYVAPNTDAGFEGAVAQAIADKMDVISISWGGPEDQWTAAGLSNLNSFFQKAAAAGITVTAAAGDNGSSDGESGNHVDFPASSPYVLACGGTSLPSLSPTSEVVWNDGTNGGATGGGVSADYPLPSYQVKAGVPGGKMRGVPDAAGNADPNTGWLVPIDAGSNAVIGGTSAVAPMWAAIAAYLSQVVGKNVGQLAASLYTLPAGCMRDITSGNNGTYIAKAGWDACTGQGVPVVMKLAAALTPTPTPPPAPAPTSSTRTIVVSGTSLTVTVDGKVT